MLRVKFNDSNSAYNVEFSRITDDIVQLLGNVPMNTSGFKVYRLNDNFLGDYTEYTVIVAELKNGLQYGKKSPL